MKSHLLVLLASTAISQAQISVGSGTTGPITFDTAPVITEWATLSVAGTWATTADMDTTVATLDIAAFVDAPVADNTAPATHGRAYWYQTGQYIYTDPTGNAGTALAAKLQNNTGGVLTNLTVSYDLGGTESASETVPGHRVYYSLTGAPGSWTPIPGLGGGTIGPVSSEVILASSWGPGTILYLMWVDDNASTNPDGIYTIDNVTITVTGGGGGALAIFDPSLPSDLTVQQYSTATFTFSVSGGSPMFQWYKSGQPIVNATNANYVINNIALTNAGNYFCIATNNINSVTSRVATLTVNAAPPQGVVAIVTGTNGPITFSAQTATNGWTTLSFGGGAGDVETAAAVDADVIANITAAQVTTALPTTTAAIGGTSSGTAQWQSTAQVLFTKPTGNRYTVLMATLQNNSGDAINSLHISYDAGLVMNTGVALNDPVGGWRVFYSLTGAAQSWIPIPSLSGVITSQPVQADLDFTSAGSWAAGAPVYIIWVDDNGAPGSTTSGEGGFTMDNVAFTVVGGSGPLTNLNVNLPANLTLEEYDKATFTFSVSGSSPRFQWYKNGVAIPGATSASYVINSVNPTNAGNYSVIATNSFNSVTSRVAAVTVNPDVTKPAIASIQFSSSNLITVTFTEAITAATATNLANYKVTQSGSNLPIASVALVNTNTVRLTLSTALPSLGSSLLTVHGVQDLAYVPNTLDFSLTKTVPGASQQIFAMTNIWKYYTNGTDLGTAWKETSYNDAAWPSGPGVLGFENTAATITAFQNAGEALRTPFGAAADSATAFGYITYYFRTTFEVTNNPAGLGLQLDGWIDDGAVFYVNGQEAGWIWPNTGGYPNLTTPNPNPPRYNTTTPDDMGNETVIKTIILTAPIRQGVNTLAVEVHQNGTGSSDIVLGLRGSLYPAPASPVIITAQPASLTVPEGQSASLTVGASGSLLSYQWYVNNQPIPGANSATLAYNPAYQTNSGSFKVVVSNNFSSATSQVATLVVAPDSTPPVVTYSMMDTNGDIPRIPEFGVSVVTIQFSEPVNEADVTNLIANPSGGYASPNYFFTREGDPTNTTLHIWEATLDASGTNLTVIVQGKQESPAVNYRLYIGNIRDRAPTPNRMVATSLFTYLRLFIMKGSGGEVQPGVMGWRYNWTGANLGTTWKETTYNDKTAVGWEPPVGQYQGDVIPAPFYTTGEDGNANFPNGWGSAWVYIPFSQTVTTYYYRTTFNLPGDPAGVLLRFEVLADDGCVFWLNGSEVRSTLNDAANPNGRYYMVNGTNTVLATSFAQDHEAGAPSQRILLNPIVLKATNNVLAVEVHQSSTDLANAQPDSAFAMQIVATLPPIGKPLRPTITSQPTNIIAAAGANITFTATGDGSMPITARWYFNTNTFLTSQNVTAATNLITLARNNISVANEGTYTLTLSNAAGVVTSAVATLTVQKAPAFSSLSPTNSSVAVGATVTFAAVLTGTSPMNYQWYFNGTNRLYGETNTFLTLLNGQVDNSGAYSLRAWNPYGTNTSSAATLVVGGGLAPAQPRMSNMAFANGLFGLRIVTEAGHTYTLQRNDDNVADRTRWFPVAGAGATVTGDGTAKTLLDNTATVPKRFYRVAVSTP